MDIDIILRYNTLCNNSHAIIFCWIPGHTGIKGNVEADKATKSASTLPITHIPLPASDFTPSIKHYNSNLWQGLYGTHTQIINSTKFIPQLTSYQLNTSLIRKDQVIINRLVIGHFRLTHVHLTRDLQHATTALIPLLYNTP